ncbi:hypothetical protein WUBG_06608 [Wuchereria bancrofti]|uniref:Secreted protein n=1 Tax=Wuchereria bancrofti TaxID=6293 RepID=J9EZ58_WUCBA|nr:hypothetical protein WUBG_06608 [Wuchereria bancrofti]
MVALLSLLLLLLLLLHALSSRHQRYWLGKVIDWLARVIICPCARLLARLPGTPERASSKSSIPLNNFNISSSSIVNLKFSKLNNLFIVFCHSSMQYLYYFVIFY